jgi:hypothetical protein
LTEALASANAAATASSSSFDFSFLGRPRPRLTDFDGARLRFVGAAFSAAYVGHEYKHTS